MPRRVFNWAMIYAGELAALLTAFLWSFTTLFFTSAGRLIGSRWVNRIRIPMAVILLGTLYFITSGYFWPSGVNSKSYLYLAASGVIGLTLGDSFLFKALVIMGPRRTLVVFATWPIIASVTAWITLGETLGILALSGIALTIAGVIWVTAERQFETEEKPKYAESGSIRLGIILALLAAAGQAIGLVLAKAGMGENLEPLPATLIRMAAAAVAVWILSLFGRDLKNIATIIKNKKALAFTLGGAICGPFLGVWMSLTAVHHTATGTASAIMSIVPILVIPLVIIFYKEKVSLRAIVGAVIAVAGVIILFYS